MCRNWFGLHSFGGVCLLVICGLFGGIFRIRKEEGKYPLRSVITIQWAFSLVAHRVARVFLGLIVPSLGTIYYRMMGAKIGKGVQLNSMNINDASMISIGDGVVVGGDATINGHLVESGEIVLAPVRIGDRALIGGGSIIQPGCTIGSGQLLHQEQWFPSGQKFLKERFGEEYLLNSSRRCECPLFFI